MQRFLIIALAKLVSPDRGATDLGQALIVGREATGIPASAEGEADEFVHIPMAQGVESLNVAAAAAILLYEAARQRGFRFKRTE